MSYRSIRRRVRDLARTAAAGYEIATKYRGISSLRWVRGHLVADVQKTPGGPLFVHLLDLGVGRPLYSGGEYEREETAFLQRALRPGMTMIDVGANVGYMSLVAAKSVGAEGAVLAIEPEPGNLQLLAENVARNGCRNVTICACAVGGQPGTATLYRSAWNMGNHRLNAGTAGQAIADETIQVPVETVDQLVNRHGLPHVDVVKIDVEGYEPGVLAGLVTTIARDRPTILTEFWPYAMRDAGFDPEAFLDTCLRAGYVVYAIDALDRPLRSVGSVLQALPDQGPATYVNLVLRHAGEAL